MISVLDTREEADSKLTLKLWIVIINIHHIDENLRDIRELTVITIYMIV